MRASIIALQLGVLFALMVPALAEGVRVAPVGAPQVMFTPKQGCDGNDIPDAPARVFRASRGGLVMFGLHDTNRAFRGPDLDHMRLDCDVVLASRGNPNPAAYDDHSWITALFTRDGTHVSALIHHEFHGNEHKGACLFRTMMQCWYNTILEMNSSDGARHFARGPDDVVAAVPFRADAEEGRHRGFFNPSNIVPWRGAFYFMAGTTGWPGQPGGVCLFQSHKPEDAGSWRAWTGQGFDADFPDPYRHKVVLATHCKLIAPFPAPVGAVVWLRDAHEFLATFMARRDDHLFPVSGFYYASSSDLKHWNAPRLLLAGATYYDDPCTAGGQVIAYPSLLDPQATSQIFADSDSAPWLYFTRAKVEGCSITGERDLMRLKLEVRSSAQATKKSDR